MKETLDLWEKKAPVLTRIHVQCAGGLGDNVCQEPILRYMTNTVYKDRADMRFLFTIGKDRECVLKHLERDPRVKIGREEDREVGKPYHVKNAHPRVIDSALLLVPPYQECHNVDYGMYALLKQTIPVDCKKACMAVNQAAWDELYSAGFPRSTHHFDNRICVHPGTGWASKTFPVKWWQEVVDGLQDDGWNVFLFGHDCPRIDAVHHGVLPVKCPEGGFDLRNKISIGSMCALISACHGCLTNDSAPVHIAGCFGNWLFFVPTCKKPELVVPFGHEETVIIRGPKLTCDDTGVLTPHHIMPASIADCPEPIENYLPTPKKVVETIREFKG